jgi:amino acid transporter
MPSLIAASALLIDYILTVAVSIAAGVAALTSAFPEWHDHRVVLALGFLVTLTLGNLRGIRSLDRFSQRQPISSSPACSDSSRLASGAA